MPINHNTWPEPAVAMTQKALDRDGLDLNLKQLMIFTHGSVIDGISDKSKLWHFKKKTLDLCTNHNCAGKLNLDTPKMWSIHKNLVRSRRSWEEAMMKMIAKAAKNSKRVTPAMTMKQCSTLGRRAGWILPNRTSVTLCQILRNLQNKTKEEAVDDGRPPTCTYQWYLNTQRASSG